MSQQTITDIYAANASIHNKLKEAVTAVTDPQLSTLPDGEKWNVSQIVEHVSIVQEAALRICSKLLSAAQAENQMSDGKVEISENFGTKSTEVGALKLEAPERVQPSHGRTIKESLTAMDETEQKLNDLKELFAKYDCNSQKFPHPFFGDLSAAEWLILVGGHEARHLKQIRNLVAKIG